jgi:hypothetical protein
LHPDHRFVSIFDLAWTLHPWLPRGVFEACSRVFASDGHSGTACPG